MQFIWLKKPSRNGLGGSDMVMYICFRNYGTEGCSEPLAAFLNKEKAEIYEQVFLAAHGSGLQIKEMDVL